MLPFPGIYFLEEGSADSKADLLSQNCGIWNSQMLCDRRDSQLAKLFGVAEHWNSGGSPRIGAGSGADSDEQLLSAESGDPFPCHVGAGL